MIRLHQTFGAHTGRTLTFDGGPIRCGRLPDSEIAFDPNADLDASGSHAEIRHEGGTWVLYDVGSRNGTWIAGTRIKHATLAHGDEVEFGAGGPRLRVELLGDSAVGEATPLAQRAALFERPSSGRPAPAVAPAPTAWAGDPSTSQASTSGRRTPAEPTRPTKPQGVPAGAEEPAGKSGATWWIAAALGCLGLLAVGLAAGVGFWWLQRVRTPPPTAEQATRIAQSHAGALFTVFYRDSNGTEHETCAGFAVRRDLVATSARCVYALQAAGESELPSFARAPGGSPMAIREMFLHPGMPAGAEDGPDIGLLRVDGSVVTLATLAPSQSVDGIPDGTAVFVWAAASNGGGLRGGRITSVGDLPNGGGTAQRLEYELVGTPGSPLFDRDGRVVGVHASVVSQGAVPGYGVRVDVLHGLLGGL